MSTQTRTVLWSVPRSVSTAFERAIVQLSLLLRDESDEEIAVFHEPLSQAFYYSKEQNSTRFPVKEGQPGFQEIISSMIDSKAQHVFSKDMAYYTRGRIKELVSSRMKHTFIIRHPSKTVPSLYRGTFACENYEQELAFDPGEVGFVELLDVYNYAKELGQTPIVIDSDDLLSDPEAYMQAYCLAVGLPWRPDMLHWERGVVPKGWEDWDGWHTDAIDSDGLKKRQHASTPTPTSASITKNPGKYDEEMKVPAVLEAVAMSLAAYEELAKHKLAIFA